MAWRNLILRSGAWALATCREPQSGIANSVPMVCGKARAGCAEHGLESPPQAQVLAAGQSRESGFFPNIKGVRVLGPRFHRVGQSRERLSPLSAS
jgi:hypothetical protein